MARRRSASPPSSSFGRPTESGTGNDRGLVIHRVVKEGWGRPANYPVLSKTNYNDWALLMKIKLEAKCLWGAIEPSGVIERHVDRMALDAICSAVPSEMISTLTVKESAKEAWESIRVMRIGDNRIRKTSAQRLRRQYEELTLRDGEGVEDFTLRLTGIVNQLSTLGDPEDPNKVVEKYLRIARVRYKQLVISAKTLLDISTLSIEEVTGRLLASEDNPEPTSNQVGGKLFLTEERSGWSGTSRRKRETAAPTTTPAVVASVAAQKEKDAEAGTRIRAKHPARRQFATATPAAIAANSAIGPGSAGVERGMNMANKVNRLMWPKLMRPPSSSRTPVSSPPLRQHCHRRSLLEFQVIPRQHSSWHSWRRHVNASSWWRRKSSPCSTMRKSVIRTDGSSTPEPPTT